MDVVDPRFHRVRSDLEWYEVRRKGYVLCYMSYILCHTYVLWRALNSKPRIDAALSRWWEGMPYRVGYGLPVGLPKCRGCKTIFRERNKPRVMADCLFYPPFSSPYPGQVAFCVNVDCIRKGTVSDKTSDNKGIFKVWVFHRTARLLGFMLAFSMPIGKARLAFQGKYGTTWRMKWSSTPTSSGR